MKTQSGSLTRSELIDALVAHDSSPYGRATLEKMNEEELAAAANSVGAPFEELATLAGEGRSGAGSGPDRGPLAILGHTSGDGEDLGFEAGGVLAGNRGDSVLDDEGGAREIGGGILAGPRGSSVLDGDPKAENAGEGPDGGGEGDLDVAGGGILSGRRGTSPLDD